jgi:hypothetical protein
MRSDSFGTRASNPRFPIPRRTRGRVPTEAEEALERATRLARRSIESEQLPSSAELRRAEGQLKIFDEHERRQAELAAYTARNEIRQVRAWILTFNLVIVCAWGTAGLLAGETVLVSPAELWHLLVSI